MRRRVATACESVLRDPCASYWLKSAVRGALQRDPIDAANDAEVLANLLRRRAEAILKGEPHAP